MPRFITSGYTSHYIPERCALYRRIRETVDLRKKERRGVCSPHVLHEANIKKEEKLAMINIFYSYIVR